MSIHVAAQLSARRLIIFGLVFLSPPILKKLILQWFCGAKFGRKSSIGWFSAVIAKHIEIGDYSEIRPLTLIKCDGDVKIGKYSIISNFVLIYGSSGLFVGNHSRIDPQSLVNTDEDVCIGNFSALGPRCMVYTHAAFLPYTEGYLVEFAGVTIGDYVWIAAGVFIRPGVKIGNNVFINVRSVVTEDVPDGEVVWGFPAKRVTYMNKIRRNMTPKRVDMVARQIVRHFAEAVLDRKMGVNFTENASNCLSFNCRGRQYLLWHIPSESNFPIENKHCNKRVIFLVNQQNWTPPANFENPIVFDLTSMRTSYSRDQVCSELYQFMKRYGIQFEYQEG